MSLFLSLANKDGVSGRNWAVFFQDAERRKADRDAKADRRGLM